MKIVINDIAASYGGALTVLKEVYNYIKENDKTNEYIFLLSEKLLEETENIKIILCPKVKKSWLHKLWFDFVSGKKLLNSLNADCVISLQNIITFGYKGLQKVYIHQSIPFQKTKKFSFLKKNEMTLAVYQYLIGAIIKLSAKKADAVFVQTEWMKKAVKTSCNLNNDRIHVIPISVEHVDHCIEYSCRGNKFFYPATFDGVYKNHRIIYDAVKLLKQNGEDNFKVVLTLNKKTTDENIEYCGLLNKQELFKNYSDSILIFPSYIETIGLPLVEAMSVGAVILVADCEYSHEVLAGYENAYMFDAFNSNQLFGLMKKCIDQELKSNGVRKIHHQSTDWGLLFE